MSPFCFRNKYKHIWARVGNDLIWESRTVKLLGITIDNELKFDVHIKMFYSRGTNKKIDCRKELLDLCMMIICLPLMFYLNKINRLQLVIII